MSSSGRFLVERARFLKESRYPVDLPAFWAEATPSRRNGMELIKTVVSRNVTFDLVLVAGGGDRAADGYLAAGLNAFSDGGAHVRNETHLGRVLRGVRIVGSGKLGGEPGALVEYYTTLVAADMLGFSLAVFGPTQAANDPFPGAEEIERLRFLMMTFVQGGIVRAGIDSTIQTPHRPQVPVEPSKKAYGTPACLC